MAYMLLREDSEGKPPVSSEGLPSPSELRNDSSGNPTAPPTIVDEMIDGEPRLNLPMLRQKDCEDRWAALSAEEKSIREKCSHGSVSLLIGFGDESNDEEFKKLLNDRLTPEIINHQLPWIGTPKETELGSLLMWCQEMTDFILASIAINTIQMTRDMFYDVLQDRLIHRDELPPYSFRLDVSDFNNLEDVLQVPEFNRDADGFHKYCLASRGPRKFFPAILSWDNETCPQIMEPWWDTLIPLTEGFLCWANKKSMKYPQRSFTFVLKAEVEPPRTPVEDAKSEPPCIVDPWEDLSWDDKDEWKEGKSVEVELPSSCEAYESMFDEFVPEEKYLDEIILLREKRDVFSSCRLELDDQDWDTFVGDLTTSYWRRCISFIVEKNSIPRAYLIYGGFRFRIKTKKEIDGVFKLFIDYRKDQQDIILEEGVDWSSAGSSDPVFDDLFETCKTTLNNAKWFEMQQ